MLRVFSNSKIVLSITLIAFSIVALIVALLKTIEKTNIGLQQNFGQIGDYFNGIASPFIALVSAILVFFAFWEQVKANQELMKLQQAASAIEATNQFREYLTVTFERIRLRQNEYQERIASFYNYQHLNVKYEEPILSSIRTADTVCHDIGATPFSTIKHACEILSLDGIDKFLHEYSHFMMNRNHEIDKFISTLSHFDISILTTYQLSLIHEQIEEWSRNCHSQMEEAFHEIKIFGETEPVDSWYHGIIELFNKQESLFKKLEEKGDAFLLLQALSSEISNTERVNVLAAYGKYDSEEA